MKAPELALYHDLLGDIKTRVRQAQRRAVVSANAEMILMYRDIGQLIAVRQKEEGWGAGVIPRLAADLKNELPELKGFSESNLKRMVQFCLEYPGLGPIGAQPAPHLKGACQQESIGAQAAPQITAGSSVLQFYTDLNTPMEAKLGMPSIEDIETELASGMGMEHTE